MTMLFVPTPEQAAVIALSEGSYLVTVPPGSGKTQVLTQRIVRLLRESKGQSFRILALTFTTKAAENMRARIEAEAGEDWRRVTTATFHSFCLDVLQHYGEHVGIAGDLTIYENETDRIEALARGLADEGLPVGRSDEDLKSLRALLQQIGRLKRDLVPSSAVLLEPHEGEDVASIDLAYPAYDRTLRLFHAVDFDDLLGLAYRLFTEAPRVARHYRRLFRYVLIDEAQDTSRAQYEVLKTLCGAEHRNVMLVADADQYIYRFAGASDKYLESFLQDFQAHHYPLSLNFRSAESIVDAANALIEKNCVRLLPRPSMQSRANARGFVTAASYPDEESEAHGVSDMVQALLRNGLERGWLYPTESTELAPSQISILGRNRYLMNAVVEDLKERQIPHRFSTTEVELFESSPFRTIYYGLRVLVNPRDLLSRRNLLASIGLVNGEGEEYFSNPSTEIFERLGEEVKGRRLRALLQRFGAALRSMPALEDLIAGIIEEAQALAKSSTEGERALQLADLESFQNRWRIYRKRVEESERALQGFMGEISLSSRAAAEGPGVHVLTVHAAKGLEYRAVILVGMNQGSFPDFRSAQSPDGLDEERRNAYVAITRAARRLHLTRPRRRRMPWGDEKFQEPSQFIQEMNIAMKDL